MRIGIVGGGQLGRMLALAAHPLGIRCTVLDPRANCCASDVAGLVQSEFDDVAAIERLASESDVVTFEFENVHLDALHTLKDSTLLPPLDALAAAQDRLTEKRLFRSLGIATPEFAAIDSIDALKDAIEPIGIPAVLKTRRMGYDGKGQFVIRDHAQIADAWSSLGGVPLILEGFVPFQRELSIIAARSRDGRIVVYPLTQTTHIDGILAESITPAAGVSDAMISEAHRAVSAVADTLNYVGVLALELFDCGDRLLANEFAPRVHNSGHWSIDGAACSQFENHIRAITGLPLGNTACLRPTAMLNCIGGVPPLEELAAIPNLRVHLYRKNPRPGRKVGHVTLSADSHEALERAIHPVRECIKQSAQH